MTVYDGIMLPKISDGLMKSIYHFVAGKDDVKQRERVRGFMAMLPQFKDSVFSVASASEALARIDQAVTRQLDLLSSLDYASSISTKDCRAVVDDLRNVSQYSFIFTTHVSVSYRYLVISVIILPGVERLRQPGSRHSVRDCRPDDRPSSGVRASSIDTLYHSEGDPLCTLQSPQLHPHTSPQRGHVPRGHTFLKAAVSFSHV